VRFGAPHRHFAVTESTNDVARELAAGGAPGGTVVTAAEQTAGRGRRGRAWNAPAGKALLYSAILRPLDERHLLLPLAVPLAVCDTAESLVDVECRIKWPNDVWVEERKLAGSLIEARPQDGWAVIGVGLNVSIEPHEFPPDLRHPATSLSDHASGGTDGAGSGALYARYTSKRNTGTSEGAQLPYPAAVAGARVALNASLSHWVSADRDEILAAYRARDALRGRKISWEGGGACGSGAGQGVADGIDEKGDLMVVVPGDDRVALGAGEVSLRL